MVENIKKDSDDEYIELMNDITTLKNNENKDDILTSIDVKKNYKKESILSIFGWGFFCIGIGIIFIFLYSISINAESDLWTRIFVIFWIIIFIGSGILTLLFRRSILIGQV
jgi:hypothetical protein